MILNKLLYPKLMTFFIEWNKHRKKYLIEASKISKAFGTKQIIYFKSDILSLKPFYQSSNHFLRIGCQKMVVSDLKPWIEIGY